MFEGNANGLTDFALLSSLVLLGPTGSDAKGFLAEVLEELVDEAEMLSSSGTFFSPKPEATKEFDDFAEESVVAAAAVVVAPNPEVNEAPNPPKPVDDFCSCCCCFG